MTSEELKKMNDRDLVTLVKTLTPGSIEYERVCNVIVDRYEPQIHRNWWRLSASMNNSTIVQSMKEDYYLDAYEALWIAIQKIDLNEIKNDKWQAVGYIDFYLRNVRSRFAKEILRKGKMKSVTGMKAGEGDDNSQVVDPDVEDAYWTNEGFRSEPAYSYEVTEAEERCSKAIDTCMEGWTDLEKKIYNYLQNGFTKAEIARITKEPAMRVYQLANTMKRDMKKALNV